MGERTPGPDASRTGPRFMLRYCMGLLGVLASICSRCEAAPSTDSADGQTAPDDAVATVDGLAPPGVRVIGVRSSADDGNGALQSVDEDFDTRWSANGDGQWIAYELSAQAAVSYVQVAFYQGNSRQSFFDVDASLDGTNWTTVRTGLTSSGTTVDLETFAFTETRARFIRLVGHGNSSPESSGWNSYTEVRIQDFPIDICFPNDNECGPDDCGGDHGDCTEGSCINGFCSNSNVPKTFYASFENNTTAADIGSESIDNRNGGDMSVVANPSVTAANPSGSVLLITIPAGSSVRAEYHSQRLPTMDKGYIYTWKEFFSSGLLAGADVSWLVFSQWKTYPCSYYNGYDDVICYQGGIFNDVELNGNDLEFRYRAEPDCYEIQAPYPEGVWTSYVLEIYYTQTSDGYHRLYQDGTLLVERSGVKTLFDRFVDDGSCDLYWGVGLYSTWADAGQDSIFVYVDDMTIYDLDDGVALADVCPACVP